VEVERDGAPVVIGGARRRAVLAILLLEAGRVVPVDRLIDGVWGEAPPETAATALHGHISQLRRALGDVIVTRPPGYLLDVDPESIDIRRFATLLEQARSELGAGDAAAANASLGEALALWRGPPLAGVGDAPFVQVVSPELEELGVSAREEHFEAGLAARRGAELVPALRALVAEHPLRERARAQLMLALSRAGRRAEALEVYDDARRLFAEELGIEPGEALRRTHEAILRHEADAGREPAPAPAPTRSPPRRRRPRGRVRVIVAAVTVAIAAGAVVLAAGGSDRAEPAQPPGSGLVLVDPDELRVAASVRLPGTPTSVAATAARAWVINADDQTVSEVSAAGRRVRTFSTGASPADLAAVGDDLWLAEGARTRTQSLAPRVVALARLPAPFHAVERRVALPRGRGDVANAADGRLAVSRHAIWIVAADGALVQVDRLSGEVVGVHRLGALAVAAERNRAWIVTSDATLVAVEERGAGASAPVALTGEPRSLAVAAGAAWVRDPTAGTVTRIDPASARAAWTTRVGVGAGAIAYGHGALWAVDTEGSRLVRIDPHSGALTGAVALRGVPRDIAVSEDGIWVSVAAPSQAAGADCSGTVAGARAPDVVAVVELPLRRGSRSPTAEMAEAAAYVVRRSRFRAGGLSVGYRICDDSTAQSASWDAVKCAANGRAYARDPRVVVEVGPYNSECAKHQLPIAAAAPAGPLAMVSPTNTDPTLTRDRGRAPRAYARVIARDDRQAAAMVIELIRRGRRRVFVLDDASRSPTLGLDLASFFVHATRARGLDVVGRASFGGRERLGGLTRRVRRSGADAVYVSGALDRGAASVVRALRRSLDDEVTLAGPDLLLPVAGLFDGAGAAAGGVLISATVAPLEAMPPEGRALARALSRASGGAPVPPAAVYGAQAMEVALDAIARSDGSRASVARALRSTDLRNAPLGPVAFDTRGDLRHARVAVVEARHRGGSRELLSTAGAELVRVYR